jgi:hypothetical protein
MKNLKEFLAAKLNKFNVKLEEFAKASSYAIHR